MTSSNANREKFQVLSKFIEGDHVMVHLRPDVPGVSLPSHLTKSESVTLKFSRFFRGRLEIFEDRIEADLLFSGSYFTCTVPICSIWGITSANNENAIWPEDSPSEILKSLAKQEATGAITSEVKTTEMPKKPQLRRIK